MRFLADESCDFALVRALRSTGHDVLAVCEMAPRADDEEVMGLALEGRRILLTEDKDFGRLVLAAGRGASGVVLLRYPAGARERLSEDVAALLRERGPSLPGGFIVLQPGRVRIRRMAGRRGETR